jgi:cytoskeletal protein RodZ
MRLHSKIRELLGWAEFLQGAALSRYANPLYPSPRPRPSHCNRLIMRQKLSLLAAYVCGTAMLMAQATGGSSQSPPSPPGGPPQTTSPQTTSPQSTPPGSGSSQSTGSSSSSSTSSSSSDQLHGAYVRRIAIGATLSVVGLSPLSAGSNTTTTTPNSATSIMDAVTSSAASSRIGYGLTAQAAITEHFAFAVGGYLRRMGFTSSDMITTSVTTFINTIPTTTSTTTSTNTDARARLLDIPFMLRYYSKERHMPGGRWFLELGGAYRDAYGVRSSQTATDSSGNITSYTFNVVSPPHKSSVGYLGGAGAQFIDPFGIRVIPEVRYIRWVNQIFEDATTHTQRNQVEANLTLSF